MARRNVGSTVTIWLNEEKIRQMEKAQIRALEQTAEALHKEVNQSQIMPRDGGALQDEKTFIDYSYSRAGKVSIVTEGPYARRLYFHPEYHFQTWENPFAQGLWYKPWIDGISSDFAQKAFTRILRRELRKL